uniref:DUF4283 domain-containing protein n=1 Tax=Quercus lobata TaxID=97700 RepID=A0A7N2L0X4_QUELO
MEDLTKTWSKLNLSECEGSNVRLSEKQAEIDWGLAAKFLTQRALNLDAITKAFSPLWRATKGFKLRKEDDHIVLFTFKDKNEMLRVLVGEPWSFDKHMVVLQEYDGTKEVRDMFFDQATFWVQVHDLLLRFRNRRVAGQLCEAMGTVNRGEDDSAMEGDRFVRVRVTLNISKPLCKGRVITLDDGKDLWIPFKYEWLPNLCYWCGCLTYDDRGCDIWIESIFKTKKKVNPQSNPVQGCKPPVVVLWSEKPSLEVIWPEKQVVFSNPPDLMVPDFQQTETAHPEGDKTVEGNVYVSAVVLEDVIEAGKNFKVMLEELDKEIASTRLAETWADKTRLDKLCDELNFDEKWVVDRITRAGGLALFWKSSRFTGIYGFPETGRKVETWQLLRDLNNKYNLPWVCAGDFNEILRGHEKLGGLPRRKFTWRGKRGESMILERLDSSFATPSWLELFPATRVQHLHSNAFDHNPIIIKPEGIVHCKNKPFRFESMWMKEVGCRNTIVDAWGFPSYESNMFLASSKIKHCGVKLVEWSRLSFRSIKRQIVETSKKLVLTEEAAARGASYDQV